LVKIKLNGPALSVGALIGVTLLASGSAAAAGPAAARSYQGTISLQRTCSDADNKMNESVQFAGVVLTAGPTAKGTTSWMNTGPLAVTVAVSNVNTENPTILIPSKSFKDDKVGISLIREGDKKTYSLIVGPIENVPATIKTGGETISDVWSIQGQTAGDVALPADPSHLKGTKTMTETNGAKVVLTWDLQLK